MLLLLTFVLAMAGCGSGNQKGDPWVWVQALKADDISSVAIWYDNEEQVALSPDEIAKLITLLNDLKQSDFTENEELTGGTPAYGVQITTADDTYYINEAIAPSGTLEIKYGEKMWWIDNEALSSFIKGKNEE